MTIERVEGGGGTVITGEHTKWFQMRAQLGALKLETMGMRHSSGRSVYAHIKRTYGLRGSRGKVYEQFEVLCDRARKLADSGKAITIEALREEA